MKPPGYLVVNGRLALAALLGLALLAPVACGKYGPPSRIPPVRRSTQPPAQPPQQAVEPEESAATEEPEEPDSETTEQSSPQPEQSSPQP